MRHQKGYTYDYSQPAEYAFCQDSVLAPLAIANDLETWVTGFTSIGLNRGEAPLDFANSRALDVCAGCGVMGFELAHALTQVKTQIQNFDFLEIQAAFREHFFENLKRTKTEGRNFRWLQQPYSDLQNEPLRESYDLIVCNPPYFDLGEGTLPPNEVKQRARFFVDDTLESLLISIRSALKPNGRAYVLMKSGKKHGRDAFTLARTLLSDCEIAKIADIRGTDLVRIVKR